MSWRTLLMVSGGFTVAFLGRFGPGFIYYLGLLFDKRKCTVNKYHFINLWWKDCMSLNFFFVPLLEDWEQCCEINSLVTNVPYRIDHRSTMLHSFFLFLENGFISLLILMLFNMTGKSYVVWINTWILATKKWIIHEVSWNNRILACLHLWIITPRLMLQQKLNIII